MRQLKQKLYSPDIQHLAVLISKLLLQKPSSSYESSFSLAGGLIYFGVSR